MSLLQDRIVARLTNSFILDRAIEVDAVAEALRKEFPEVALAELIRAITGVAGGIGVRIKVPAPAISPDTAHEPAARSCARPEPSAARSFARTG